MPNNSIAGDFAGLNRQSRRKFLLCAAAASASWGISSAKQARAKVELWSDVNFSGATLSTNTDVASGNSGSPIVHLGASSLRVNAEGWVDFGGADELFSVSSVLSPPTVGSATHGFKLSVYGPAEIPNLHQVGLSTNLDEDSIPNDRRHWGDRIVSVRILGPRAAAVAALDADSESDLGDALAGRQQSVVAEPLLTYKDLLYNGRRFVYYPGEYRDERVENRDEITAVKVPSGYKALLADNFDGSGDSRDFVPGAYPDLRDYNMNDKISYIYLRRA